MQGERNSMAVGQQLTTPDRGIDPQSKSYRDRLERAEQAIVTVQPMAGRWLVDFHGSEDVHIVELEDGHPIMCHGPDCQMNGYKCKHMIAIDETEFDYVMSADGDRVEVGTQQC